MNRIYKVIWSKVKHQYVVVSELAHSNGKQSRTARRSLRSRIAALVVCGAIAAFGVFGITEQQAFAADGGVANQTQYIAIAVEQSNESGHNWFGQWVPDETRTFSDGTNTYTYHRQTIALPNGDEKQYWVREGYDIMATEGRRHDGIDENTRYIIDAKKNEQYTAQSDQGLLQAYQTTTSSGKITTLTGVNIEDLNTGVYGGASNSAGVETQKNFGYHIRVGKITETDDGYVKVSNDLDGTAADTNPAGQYGNTNWNTYFSTDIKLENNGTYSFKNGDGTRVTVPTNKIYSIDGQLGVFTDENGNLYTGDVYGDHNEILLSGVGEDNQIYSYWESKITDPTQTIGNMTVGQYNNDRIALQQQAAAYHGDDIKDITVTPNEGSNGGSLSFNRVGRYDEESGEYVPAEPAGVITFKNTELSGKEGNDVAVEIGNGTSSFTVDAGSRVVGKITNGAGAQVSAGVDDTGKTLTGLEINGVEYALSQGKTYNNGAGIAISEDGKNTISVDLATKDSGLHFVTEDGKQKLANNLKVETVSGDNQGGWKITETTDENTPSTTFTNTTLDAAGSNNINGDPGKHTEYKGDTSTGDADVVYGRDYVVKDTAGNTINLNDVASAKTLKNVAGDVNSLETTVNKGWTATADNTVNDDATTSVNVNPENSTLKFTGDDNISVNVYSNEDGKNGTIKVALKDNINVSSVKAGTDDAATTINSAGLSTGTVKVNGGEINTVTGLSNIDWDDDISDIVKENKNGEAGYAATQGQLQKVSEAANEGWTAYINGFETEVKDVHPGNDYFSFNEGDNVSITKSEDGNGIVISSKDTTLDVENSTSTPIGTQTTQGKEIYGQTYKIADTAGNIVTIDDVASAEKLMEVDQTAQSAVTEAGKHTIVSTKDNNLKVENIATENEAANYQVSLNKDLTVDSVNAGGTIINESGLTAGDVKVNSETATVTGLSNTTWDETVAANVEANANGEAGYAATQGQLQQAVSEVATEAAKKTTLSAGKNISLEQNGMDYKVSLKDDITLGDSTNEENGRSITLNTTDVNGYVPESYQTGTGADFIKENGGFMLFATDTIGHGIFGVTTNGTAHGRDFVTYTKDIYGNDTQYSLNDVGNIVTQIAHAEFSNGDGSTNMEYTLISDFANETDKDTPFNALEGEERTIGLAVREDGAVIVGAVVDDTGVTEDNGIRINAEAGENGNNRATITGLENTTWTPPTPVATFAANDEIEKEESRAATEGQLDDLYNSVVGYSVNFDGSIDYDVINLRGTPYSYNEANPTGSGGTRITNVAYSDGTGSDAVNVDYLNDAIDEAVSDNGVIANNDQHLVANTEKGSNGVYKPDNNGNVNLIVSDEKGNSSTITIGDVASKVELDNLKDNVGDLKYNSVEGDKVENGDSVTTAIGKLDNKIDNISGTATNADNNTVTGGTINNDGTISLTQKDKDTINLDGKLTDSGVIQDGTTFDKESGTLTITSQDKYSKETSSVIVDGIASEEDIKGITDTIGATSKNDLTTIYKDADKDGNTTTQYISQEGVGKMAQADVALDHAIQNVANTSYYNDTVLNNRINSVENRLGDVEERIDKVGAMAATIANLRTMGYDPEAPTEVAVGVGQYKSETGLALGIFHYPNQDFMLSASISTSGDEVMGGIGATWKLGRKSAAEREKDNEEKILAKAEEIKQAAKRAEVKAQADRHAQLLAEREAAGQPIRPVEEA
ncbi:ESPR-type extended signal peptide-containing protein [Megamonas hypermegale]|uniref:ESPR-type extended signal peptide-containing protein n=1 Tax=Megamonas hypermegale TaxID=158847 RepID=UPI0026EB62C8|nr:ESPR-type extended signal peptide-containing protein [Megamonas hypermegale]